VTTKHASKKSNIETSNSEIQKCFSVLEMTQFATENEYPRKFFLVNNQLHEYTPILHFFESIRIIDLPQHLSLRDFNIKWKCKVCKTEKDESLGSTTNLNKHLHKHSEKELK
jgi:hypothetical protein